MIRMLPCGMMSSAMRWCGYIDQEHRTGPSMAFWGSLAECACHRASFMVQGLGRLLTALVSSSLKGSANSLQPSPGDDGENADQSVDGWIYASLCAPSVLIDTPTPLGWARQPIQGRCYLLASSAARQSPSNTALRTHPLFTISSPPPKQELPWFIDGVRFICTGCGKCCRTRGDVWLSPDEVRLAAQHERLDLEGFTITYVAETDRGWARLKSKPSPHEGGGDACVFLNDDNTCSIYEARPLQCRTYPYWPSIVRSKETWDREAVVPDDRKEGRHWNAEDGGCEGINHGDAELVPFGVIWSNMRKQVAYNMERYRVSKV